MAIATYRVGTIPHDWHTIMRLGSSKVNDFNVIWKPVFDFLSVINSNLGPILHRLPTMHPLQKTTDDDGWQPCKTLQHCCSMSIICQKQVDRHWNVRDSDYVIKATSGSNRATKKLQACSLSVQFERTVESVLLLLSLCQLTGQLQLPAARETHCMANGVVGCKVQPSK